MLPRFEPLFEINVKNIKYENNFEVVGSNLTEGMKNPTEECEKLYCKTVAPSTGAVLSYCATHRRSV